MLAGALAFLINAALTPLIISLSHRFKWYDERNHRKIHTTDTPRLGGVGMFVSVVIGLAFGAILFRDATVWYQWNGRSLLLLLGGLAMIHGLGLYDDFVNLPAVGKFLVQVLAAVLVAMGGFRIGALGLPMLDPIQLPLWVSFPITVLWIVAIANAVNLIDGADGLAGGVAAFAALFMAMIAYSQGHPFGALFSVVVVGAVAGFLLYNLPTARTFMGDSGSLFLGFSLAVIPLIGFEQSGLVFPVFPVFTLVFFPVLDTALAIARRLVRGQPVHFADREHIHHRLIDLGVHGRRLLSVVYIAMVILGFTALAWYTVPENVAFALTVVVWVVGWGCVVLLGRLTRHNRPIAGDDP